MEWTNEQQQAIASRGSSLVVSAAAGSGKTAVLVERIISLIACEGVDVERLLVVTFTRAAAAEMKSRIIARLTDIATTDISRGDRLNEQALKIDRASIGTLHAFCGEFLREHFNIVGIEPTFKTEEESVIQVIFDETLKETIESFFETGTADFLALADCWGGREGKGLTELVRKVYGAARNYPNPLLWLKSRTELFNFDDPERTQWYEELIENLADSISLALEYMQDALYIACLPGGPVQYAACMEAEKNSLESLTELLASKDMDGFKHILAGKQLFGRLPGLRQPDEKMKQCSARAKEQRDEAKKL
jgi:ATP-dependent helicase/nuclease subunit A